MVSRRAALISSLSWVSALYRFQATRLAAITMLISASAWASPLHPRPGSLGAGGGATRSAVCIMAVVKAVSTSSTLLPLGGNGLRYFPITVATSWAQIGAIRHSSPVDRRQSPRLPHRSVASEATKHGSATRSAVCIMAAVKAVSTSSTMLPLGGNGLRYFPITVTTSWAQIGAICHSSPVDRRRSPRLPHRSVASEATKQFHMCCGNIVKVGMTVGGAQQHPARVFCLAAS